MAFDYTNLYPDTSANGGYTKSWNYTTVSDSIATVSASGYFNKVATRLGIGDNIVVARVDAFETRTRTTLVEYAELYISGISAGVVTTILSTTGYATLASPVFTGIPTAPTASPGTNTTQIATTAYADAIATLKANIASPTFTGTPAAPTAAVDTNTTQLATTAMVLGQAASATPLIDGVAAVGTSTRFARADHVHPTDTTRAPLASPTLTGTPNIAAATGTSLAVTAALTSSGTAGVGYATGAGGTITQITSRTTGVTLNKTCGAITLFAAAPAVGTWVSFTVTNSTVAATDVPHVAIKSGTNTYIAHVSAVAAGSFQVSFTSIVGTASDSPVISFDIIKAVNA